jgi:hypothetical protein
MLVIAVCINRGWRPDAGAWKRIGDWYREAYDKP